MGYSKLVGKRILVAEDEYLIAEDVRAALEMFGAEVMGPFATLASGLACCDAAPAPDAALLDVNLSGERVFPLAARLIADGVPCIFVTGYDAIAIPQAYRHCPIFHKPVGIRVVLDVLEGLLERPLS